MSATYADGQPVRGKDRVRVIAYGPGGARKRDLGREGWVVSPMVTRATVSLEDAPNDFAEMRDILGKHLELVAREAGASG